MVEIPTYQKVKEEQLQLHPTRQALYRKIEKLIKKPVVSIYTSFVFPVMLDDNDASMLEALLRACDLSKGIALVINSPGGLGLAAERIINVCRSYSGTKEYIAVVPNKAKSAATMICLGASQIMMGKTSELGPVDPQVSLQGVRYSVYNIVKSYEQLFEKAVRSDGNIQPYLLQLSHFDEKDIAEYKAALGLSDNIAIKALKEGMLKGTSEEKIKKQIGIFLIPEKGTKVHGRPIYAGDAKGCGLNIDLRDVNDELWGLLYELHIRLNNFVSINRNSKLIECCDKSYSQRWVENASRTEAKAQNN